METMELRGMIYRKFKNEAECARKMGWSRQRLNKITTGKKIPDVNEVNDIATALEEPVENVLYIFLPIRSTNG